jgi:hypothetical protein
MSNSFWAKSMIRRLSKASVKGSAYSATGWGNSWWSAAGSQEVRSWVVTSPNGQLTIEAETYTGLSVASPAELVAQVKKHFPSIGA